MLADALAGGEKEKLVLDERAAEAAAELVAAKILQRLAVRGGRGQRFGAKVFKAGAVDGVGAGFRYDVDYATRTAAELRVGAAGRDLKLLHGFQGDIDRRALASHLLAEESVIVVASIEADVVEDAALPVDVDLVAVRSLGDA